MSIVRAILIFISFTCAMTLIGMNAGLATNALRAHDYGRFALCLGFVVAWSVIAWIDYGWLSSMARRERP